MNASPTAPPTWRAIPRSRALYLPGGAPIAAGTRLVTGDYAETLRTIAREGPDLLYAGALGRAVRRPYGEVRRLHHARRPDAATAPSTATRCAAPIAASTSSGRRRRRPGRCTSSRCSTSWKATTSARWASARADTLHLLAEVLKIAFADRAAATADPAFVKVPVEKLLSKSYAAERRARIDLGRAQSWSAEVAPGEGGAHHAPHRGRRHGQHRRQHADDQLACSARAISCPAPA